MKKLLYTSLIVVAALSASAQGSWSFGVHAAITGNKSTFAGGMSDANALFTHNSYGAGTLGFTWRYFLNDHWSVQSGMSLSSVGFDYALAKDYSLLKKNDHFTSNNAGLPILQVPLTAIYAFNPNCRNIRKYVGVGISLMNHFSTVNKTQTAVPNGVEGTSSTDYLNQTLTAAPFTLVDGQVTGGIEKLLKKGNILQLGLLFNRGFSSIATSTVTYSVNGNQYTHIFRNNGNYAGLVLGYYFKPFGKK